ncbi:MAG: IS630 family transposase [Chloroflexi bacterium]|nr:IS630 family transposase [Chloroflexota bacterium]
MAEAQSGRPVREAAGATAETDPASLGLPVTIWTIDRLRLYLEEQTEVLLSPARFRALLHRLGYRWKQPKHDLSALQDQDAQAMMQTVLEWLKNRPPQPTRRNRAFLCGRNDHKPPSAVAALLDQVRQTPAHSRSRFALIPPCLRRLQLAQRAGYPLHLQAQEQRRLHRFPRPAAASHPRLKLILVLDNASYHRSKAVQAALSHWGDRLPLIWLPKYSPFLNPIERFWLHFKQLTVANRLHRSPDDLQITVDQVIANQNTPDHPNRLLFVDNFRLWLSQAAHRVRSSEYGWCRC